MTPTDEWMTQMTDTTATVVDAARPLNATTSRALTKLVDLDFATVESEIREMAQVEIERRKAEVEVQWADKTKAAKAWEGKATKLVREYLDNARALKNLAGDSGVSLDLPTDFRYNSTASAEVPGLDEARRKAEREVNVNLRKALLTLERERVSAHRTVMLATVTVEAERVLDSLPSAASVFQAATGQKAVG